MSESEDLGPIGTTMVELSNLELAHDEFVLKMNEIYPDLTDALANSFPRQYKKKVDFLVHSIAHIPRLRQVPISRDGFLDLQWLQFQLDELYYVRTIIAHGSISLIHTKNYDKRFRFDRITIPKRNNVRRESVFMNTRFLADVCATAHALRRYIGNLTNAMIGHFSFDEAYKREVETAALRREFKELFDEGVIDPKFEGVVFRGGVPDAN